MLQEGDLEGEVAREEAELVTIEEAGLAVLHRSIMDCRLTSLACQSDSCLHWSRIMASLESCNRNGRMTRSRERKDDEKIIDKKIGRRAPYTP